MPYFPALSGAHADAFASTDWSRSPVGPMGAWSPTLRTAVDMMLGSDFPITLFWGPEFALIYNSAYAPLIGEKHPSALGRPAEEIFPEVWALIGPMMRSTLAGKSLWLENEYVPLVRRGYLEECYFTFSYSPIRSADGVIEGGMDIAVETTEQVLSGRRMELLTRVSDRVAGAGSMGDLTRLALPVLREASRDLPEVDLRLPGSLGDLGVALPAQPSQPWSRRTELVEHHPTGAVVWLPLVQDEQRDPPYLVARLSPQLAPDEGYLDFLRLLAGALGQAAERVRVHQAALRISRVERAMSEAFQRSLLPLPFTGPGPQVAVRYQPAVELARIGGDWYDWFELPDGTLALMIGDVAGHDEDAAAAMAYVRNVLRGVAFTDPSQTPAGMLRSVERAVSAATRPIVATGVVARGRAQDGGGLELVWTNAGHPPPVIVSPDGAAALVEREPDLLLGVDPAAARRDHLLRLEPGATLVLYTDGLVERRGSGLGDGLAWLTRVLEGTHAQDIESLSDSLLAQAGARQDDVALLVLRA